MAALTAAEVRALGVVRFLDARSGPDARARFEAERLEGARWLSLEDDLSQLGDPREGGRHPLASPERFAAALAREGIAPEDTLVVLDDKDGGSAAARLYVMLRAIGHGAVHLLDGGLRAGRGVLPLAAGPVLPARAAHYPAQPYALPQIRLAEIEDRLAAGAVLLDARSAERFRGEVEPFDPPAGHVPGATSMPYAALLAEHGALLPRPALRARLEAAIGGAGEVLLQCGSGVTACVLAVALEEAGLFPIGDPRVRLWVGSYSEWSRSGRPIATGP